MIKPQDTLYRQNIIDDFVEKIIEPQLKKEKHQKRGHGNDQYPLKVFRVGIVLVTEVCGELDVVTNGMVGDCTFSSILLFSFLNLEKGVESILSFKAE